MTALGRDGTIAASEVNVWKWRTATSRVVAANVCFSDVAKLVSTAEMGRNAVVCRPKRGRALRAGQNVLPRALQVVLL
ncbi:hypothetical protein ASE71_17355 [Ensifer sp. Root954]|nr:hypothetical protein ASD49_30065 [Ensifer sp. Root1298]KQX85370.1 hypothetical protein ASD41_30645 [Ensifer sp. Root1312]KRC18950.1 hypothetical protein ASE29_07335 [Ensifer sp. Root74]KRD76760.1 hypothetical protein ASE71_17355 [Ensifer sp. Root954]